MPIDSAAIERFIAEVKWRFAKTMPDWPHWYVMRQWNPGREEEFMELVRLIFEQGQNEQWAVGTPYERTTRYYVSGEYKYWAMDPSIAETDLINRARLDGRGPDTPRANKFTWGEADEIDIS